MKWCCPIRDKIVVTWADVWRIRRVVKIKITPPKSKVTISMVFTLVIFCGDPLSCHLIGVSDSVHKPPGLINSNYTSHLRIHTAPSAYELPHIEIIVAMQQHVYSTSVKSKLNSFCCHCKHASSLTLRVGGYLSYRRKKIILPSYVSQHSCNY